MVFEGRPPVSPWAASIAERANRRGYRSKIALPLSKSATYRPKRPKVLRSTELFKTPRQAEYAE